MPSCADFGVIDQYLSLRDQVDSEDEFSLYGDSVSQYLTPTFTLLDKDPVAAKNAAFRSGTAAAAAAAEPLPMNFLDMDNSFLEEVTHSRVTAVPVPFDPSTTCGATTTTTSTCGSAIATTGTTTTSSSTPVFNHVSKAAGSGGTVTLVQPPSSSAAVVSDTVTNLEDFPDIFDLDCYKYATSVWKDSGNGSAGADLPDIKPLNVRPEQFREFRQQGGAGAHGPSGAGGAASEVHEMSDGVDSFMIQSIFDDITRVSSELNISPDPTNWSHQDTQTWVRYIFRKNQFQDDDCDTLFNVRGEVLCHMNVDDFLWRSPSAGAFLHENLDVWKMARQFLPTSTTQRNHHNHHNHHHHHQDSFAATNFTAMTTASGHTVSAMSPSTSPAPSTDSTCSTLSSSSGSLSTPSFNWSPAADGLDDEAFSRIGLHGLAQQPASGHSAHSNPSHGGPAATPHRGPRPGKQTIHLWQFLKELLDDPEGYSCIKWIDRAKGVFKIEDSSKVAKLWGRRKNRPAMNYDKLSRSVRQYYKKGIIKKTDLAKRLVYQFCQPYL